MIAKYDKAGDRGVTREEKIKILKSRKEEAETDGYVGFAEALGSAIEILEQEPSKGEKPNGTDKEIHGVREELKAIEKELHNLNRILEKRKI